jgi:hypothetical protein
VDLLAECIDLTAELAGPPEVTPPAVAWGPVEQPIADRAKA